jgi:hypothetical protein
MKTKKRNLWLALWLAATLGAALGVPIFIASQVMVRK